MKCTRCQHDNPAPVKFCGECGARFVTACPACRATNPATNNFCEECGTPLLSGALAGKFASPDSYTPRHLAEKILISRQALAGERKQVTVVFADLKGSMELLADRDPEEARKLLDPVLERMMEAVHRYEGTVNQVMGDGIMALFGAPLAHEDHAVRACYAALRMQESVRQYSEEARRLTGVAVSIRVGLNSGDVVVRSIGNDLQLDYTAVGQTTHLAARMEQAALPGSIVLTANTMRLVEGYVEVKPLGPIAIKGLREPAEVYEVIQAGPARSRLQATAARGLTRFVGRQAALEQLRQAMEHAASGHGQVVAVVGEPGVGKSRLYWELTHSHRAQSWLVIESGSVSYGKATSYFPVIDLLKAYFQIDTRDDGRRIREKVTGKLLTLERGLEPTLPAFLALLDVTVEDAQWNTMDPPQRRHRTIEAVKGLLLRESQVQPLLLVFEDLHWIDSETQRLLDGLVESLPAARILLLVNYRPEYQHGWSGKTYYTQLRIDPLPPESAEELLSALVGADPALGPLKQLLIERTQGNPFFLEEAARTLVETRVLVGERGAYQLSGSTQSIQVPATVQSMLTSRIDRLPSTEKRLLQCAAVVGKDVPFALLRAVADEDEETLHAALGHLQSAEFLYEIRLFPDLEYTFKHALTHEVAYGSLLGEQRRALHARIVEAIESLSPDPAGEQIDRLAHHAFRAEAWDKAVAYSRQASARAASRSAYREAVAGLERALESLRRLPESRETLERGIDVRFELRNALAPLGEYALMLERLHEAETVARALGDQRRLGWLHSYMCNGLRLVNEHEAAVEFGHQAFAVATTLGDFALQISASYHLGQAYHTLGDYRRAKEFLATNVEAIKGERLRERFGLIGLPAVQSRTWLVWCHAELGEFVEGLACGHDALRIAQEAADAYSEVAAYAGIGNLYLRKGDINNASPLLTRGLAICQERSILEWFPRLASSLGVVRALQGRLDDALPLLEQAGARAESMGITWHPLWGVRLGEVYVLAGRLDDAERLGQRARDLAIAHKERGHQAYSFRLLGEIAARRDPPALESAEGAYRQAVALAEELGMRPLLAQCHLSLGRLYRRIARSEQARAELTRAAQLFRAMDMTLWFSQAETELAQQESSLAP
jgi:predicted ATPase/class 3 adenylate cyclase